MYRIYSIEKIVYIWFFLLNSTQCSFLHIRRSVCKFKSFECKWFKNSQFKCPKLICLVNLGDSMALQLAFLMHYMLPHGLYLTFLLSSDHFPGFTFLLSPDENSKVWMDSYFGRMFNKQAGLVYQFVKSEKWGELAYYFRYVNNRKWCFSQATSSENRSAERFKSIREERSVYGREYMKTFVYQTWVF